MTEFTRRGKHGAVQVTIGNCDMSCSWVGDGETNCGETLGQPFRMREHLVKSHAKGLVKHPFVCPTCRKCSRQRKGLSQCPCRKSRGADASQTPATPPNPNQTSITDQEVEILDRVAASLYPLNNQQHLDTAVATIDWANSQIGHIQRRDRQNPRNSPTSSSRGTQPLQHCCSSEGISSGIRDHVSFPSVPPPPMDPSLLAHSHYNVDPEDDNIDYDDDDDDSEKGGVY
ncbi:hypothetical protein K440DRAFT_632690 [Wilcoxina mikolae CBS 423.85]|nr:hypothetical protein K440DRAFT_632690 [Wilcoxina mikolae CBS 423.85]